ncbi:MAG: PfkB family carbohydrate kinase [Desulfocapsaceae bacterium]
MARGLFVGLTTVDIFNVVDRHPRSDQKIKAHHQAVSAGGPAANAAVAYAAFGNETDLLTGLGGHPTGAMAFEDLQKHGVTVHDYSSDPAALPVLSSILINSSNGSRCVVYRNPLDLTLSPDQLYDHLTKGCQVVLLDGFYLEQAISVAKAAKGHSLTVLDGGSWKEGLEELLPFIDYAICSADFKAPSCNSPEELLLYLEHIGITGSAVSRGADSIIYRIEGKQGQQPVPQVQAIDTLGAGDILHGTFCHHILTSSFLESLEKATFSASRSCLSYGTRKWISNL